jgi:hypothetical protein
METAMHASGVEEHEAMDLEPGSTRVLSESGWEEVDYVDPAEDWHLLGDGSWESPDGQTRSWPLTGPERPEPD